jgi:hypothetical protein
MVMGLVPSQTKEEITDSLDAGTGWHQPLSEVMSPQTRRRIGCSLLAAPGKVLPIHTY